MIKCLLFLRRFLTLFLSQSRGQIEIKGKGHMPTFWVRGLIDKDQDHQTASSGTFKTWDIYLRTNETSVVVSAFPKQSVDICAWQLQ